MQGSRMAAAVASAGAFARRSKKVSIKKNAVASLTNLTVTCKNWAVILPYPLMWPRVIVQKSVLGNHHPLHTIATPHSAPPPAGTPPSPVAIAPRRASLGCTEPSNQPAAGGCKNPAPRFRTG